MATSVPIQPPQQFDFKKPDEWAKWKRGFERFLSASGLDNLKEDDARVKSTRCSTACLGSTRGEEAEGG